MSRTSWLLSLIIFTITGDSLGPVQAGLVMAAQDQFQVERRSFEKSEDPPGSWRSQDESSWRDGDALPPFLFAQYPGYRLDHQPPGYKVKDNTGQVVEDPEASQVAQRRPDLDGPFHEDDPVTVKHKDPSAAYQEVLEARMNEYEMNDEEYLKPRPRKRRPPQNYEFALAAVDGDRKSASRKGSRSRAQSEPQPRPGSRSGAAVELKSLLKMQQEEGLSLSELLQRRNLSLNDLLKGRSEVISALKAKDIEENDQEPKVSALDPPPEDRTPGSRDPHVQGHPRAKGQALSVSGDLGDQPEPESSNNSSGDTLRSEVSIGLWTPSSSSTNAPSSSSTSAPLTLRPQARDSTESVREEPRSESLDDDEIMEFSDFTEFKKGKSNSGPQAWLALGSEEATGDVGSTLSIEQILQPTEKSSTEVLEVVSLTSDLEQQLKTDSGSSLRIDNGSSSLKTVPAQDSNSGLEQDYQDDAPPVQPNTEEFQVESGSPTERSDLELKEDISEDGLTTLKETTEEGVVREDKQYEETISEVEPEARAEIFELFASGSAGKRLEKLLKSRNMSLEELIALRQRGSSKVHLADVSRLKVPKPETGRHVDQVDPAKETDQAGETDRTEQVDQPEEGLMIKETTPARETDHLGDTDQTNRPDQPKELDPIKLEIDQTGEGDRTREAVQSEGIDPVREIDQLGQVDQSGEVGEIDDQTKGKQTEAKDDDLSQPENRLLESLFQGGVTLTLKDSANDPLTQTTGNLLESPPSLGQGVTEVKGTRRVEIEDLLTTFGSLPFTKIIQRELDGDLAPYQISKTLVANEDPDDLVAVKVEGQSGLVEEVARQEPSSIDLGTILKEEVEEEEEEEDTGKVDVRRNLARVRPSIIASGAILGVTIVVFLAIFLACRIRQRQRYRYRNRFPRGVFQGPALAARKLSNSSSLSTVMVNVVTTSTTKRADKHQAREPQRNEIDNDSLDANDSWETIPDYAK